MSSRTIRSSSSSSSWTSSVRRRLHSEVTKKSEVAEKVESRPPLPVRCWSLSDDSLRV